ncbi:MAG: hypothetical protein HY290_13810 [Planctomycetia bacterium]|nr:hypothetical protein [Planctomycetia bacterium]
MSEGRMFAEFSGEEILKQVAPLPVLSTGLRSRVLAAAVEAQESRRHGRRVIAGSLSLFALLSWVSWRGPISRGGAALAAAAARDGAASADSAADAELGLFKTTGDDFSAVEVQLRSRQDYFPRVHPM